MSTTDMTREAWLDRRRAGIGGSDVAALLGLSRWKTPLDVFLDKAGRSRRASPETGDDRPARARTGERWTE